MPLTIKVPAADLFDPKSGRFITTKEITLTFEHSLLSISKWEAKWHKSFFLSTQKTDEENLDYLRCMCLTKDVDPNVFKSLGVKNAKVISDYIADPMTGTTIKHQKDRPSREIITSELVYFWMSNFGIPFSPCEKWHFNRLMTLIEIASIKNTPPKKMGAREAAHQRSMLNAQRRAKFHSRG